MIVLPTYGKVSEGNRDRHLSEENPYLPQISAVGSFSRDVTPLPVCSFVMHSDGCSDSMGDLAAAALAFGEEGRVILKDPDVVTPVLDSEMIAQASPGMRGPLATGKGAWVLFCHMREARIINLRMMICLTDQQLFPVQSIGYMEDWSGQGDWHPGRNRQKGKEKKKNPCIGYCRIYSRSFLDQYPFQAIG